MKCHWWHQQLLMKWCLIMQDSSVCNVLHLFFFYTHTRIYKYIYSEYILHLYSLDWRLTTENNRWMCSTEIGKEAAQVQELYLYNYSPLGTGTVLKYESQHFYSFCSAVYHICRISDVDVLESPRTEMQRCRGRGAVLWRTVAVLGSLIAPPSGQRQITRRLTRDESWQTQNTCQCQGYSCCMMTNLLCQNRHSLLFKQLISFIIFMPWLSHSDVNNKLLGGGSNFNKVIIESLEQLSESPYKHNLISHSVSSGCGMQQ